MLRIWGRPNSINVQKVLWAAAELELLVEAIPAGGPHPPVDPALNPNRLVPVIDDDGFVLWESNAIVRYLATRAGRLIPTDVHGRAVVEMWMDWQQTSFVAALRPIFLTLVRGQGDVAAVPRHVAATEAQLAILDARLATSLFVGGDAFGVADIVVGVTASRWSKLPIAHAPRPHVDRWLNGLRDRPGFARHVDLPLS